MPLDGASVLPLGKRFLYLRFAPIYNNYFKQQLSPLGMEWYQTWSISNISASVIINILSFWKSMKFWYFSHSSNPAVSPHSLEYLGIGRNMLCTLSIGVIIQDICFFFFFCKVSLIVYLFYCWARKWNAKNSVQITNCPAVFPACTVQSQWRSVCCNIRYCNVCMCVWGALLAKALSHFLHPCTPLAKLVWGNEPYNGPAIVIGSTWVDSSTQTKPYLK